MRKYSQLFALVVLICCVLVGCQIWNADGVKSFAMEEYQSFIDAFPSEENVGSIADSEDAIRKAEAVWIEHYGEGVKEQQPYRVFYDDQNDVWLVQGTLKGLRRKGGVPNILIKGATGDVIAVWHEE